MVHFIFNQGIFENSQIKKGKVNTFDGIEYVGSLKNLKRHGRGQTEVKKGCYEFIGDFENDKRLNGKFTYNQKNEKFKYARNIEIENFNKVKLNMPIFVKIRFKYKDREYFYEGKVLNNAINDENGILTYSKKGYPKYEGAITDNSKHGKGKYWWSMDEIYSGTFKNNKLNTKSNNGGMKEFFYNTEKVLSKRIDRDEICLLKNGDKSYSLLLENGDLLGYQEIIDQ